MRRYLLGVVACVALLATLAPVASARRPPRGLPLALGFNRTVMFEGYAYAPAWAPLPVRQAVGAGNRLIGHPYIWGGGHGGFEDHGYDCSGSVSYVLHRAHLLRSPLTSGELMSWGLRGRGRWISVYASPGHTFIVVAGLRLDTSGGGPSGPRWRPFRRSVTGFAVRHPRGL